MTTLPDIDWPTRHMSEAYLSARKSKDPRTQVGAVIVGDDQVVRSSGYNGPCRGMNDDDPRTFFKPGPGQEPPFLEHAERNAILNSARIGIPTDGCSIYVTLHPCHGCARAIVQAGIKRVILHAEAPGDLNETQRLGAEVFERCGIPVETWSGETLIDAIRYDGLVHVFGKGEQ